MEIAFQLYKIKFIWRKYTQKRIISNFINFFYPKINRLDSKNRVFQSDYCFKIRRNVVYLIDVSRCSTKKIKFESNCAIINNFMQRRWNFASFNEIINVWHCNSSYEIFCQFSFLSFSFSIFFASSFQLKRNNFLLKFWHFFFKLECMWINESKTKKSSLKKNKLTSAPIFIHTF